jgi:hemolysin activation/secretion protein
LQPILGGMDNLRGFRTGTAVGDTLVAGSVEVRTPITSPLNVAKLGVSAFFDTATVYDHRERLQDQRFLKGVGGSVWLSAAFFRLNLAVAHGLKGSTRVHFGTSFSY